MAMEGIIAKEETIKPSKGAGSKQVFAVLSLSDEEITAIYDNYGIDITDWVEDVAKTKLLNTYAEIQNNPYELDYKAEESHEATSKIAFVRTSYIEKDEAAGTEHKVVLKFYHHSGGDLVQLTSGFVSGNIVIQLRDGFTPLEFYTS